ncbi:MAG: hypothetical protein QOI44_1318, partial [Actinomycetota bacterium]|nr:hypothetical protein [Actinomycetota bacterium]
MYDVFISYSHAGDSLLSDRLQTGLQRFAKPWWRRRATSVFRDTTGLTANPGLWSSIVDAMEQSRFFLLLASPEAAASPWVSRELTQWLSKPRGQQLLVLLTDGELVWDENGHDFDWEATTALPSVLAGAFSEEPRHVDIRWARTEEQLDLSDGRFRNDIADLAAPIRGVAKDDLAGEDVRQHRRTLRHAWAAGLALLVMTIAALVTSILAASAATTARNEQHRADAQAQLASQQSRIATDERNTATEQRKKADANARQASTNAR